MWAGKSRVLAVVWPQEQSTILECGWLAPVWWKNTFWWQLWEQRCEVLPWYLARVVSFICQLDWTTVSRRWIVTAWVSWLQELHLPGTVRHMNIWRNRDCETKSKPAQEQTRHNTSTEKGEVDTQSPTPNQEALFNWWLLGKRKIRFGQWPVTEYISHIPGQTPCPGAIGQHKMDSLTFVCTFCFVLVFFLFY